jgi:hypothetical protein
VKRLKISKMAKAKVDLTELYQMVAEGKTGKAIAEYFGVSQGYISQLKKQMGKAAAMDVQLVHAEKFIDEHLNTVAQLRKINEDAHELLDLCMRWVRGDEEAIQILETQVRKVRVGRTEEYVDQYKFKDPREIALKAMQRIEAQLRLQNETLSFLANLKAVSEFQQDVIRILRDVCPPEVADEFCKRWDKSRALPRLLQLDRPRT